MTVLVERHSRQIWVLRLFGLTDSSSKLHRALLLGHRNYRTIQRYAHIADYALRDAVNRTSKTIMQAGRSGSKSASQSRSRRPR